MTVHGGGASTGSCRFPPGVINSDNMIDAPGSLSKKGMVNPALFDTVFCIEVTFAMGDWDSRTGTKSLRKIARLGVDEYRLFAFCIRIGSSYGGFVVLVFYFCPATCGPKGYGSG